MNDIDLRFRALYRACECSTWEFRALTFVTVSLTETCLRVHRYICNCPSFFYISLYYFLNCRLSPIGKGSCNLIMQGPLLGTRALRAKPLQTHIRRPKVMVMVSRQGP